MEDENKITTNSNTKLLRCAEWLKNQNRQPNKKILQHSLFNQNAEKYKNPNTIETCTVPDGVNEPDIKPKSVPLKRLRVDRLSMVCEWQDCKLVYGNYESFQKHIRTHTPDVLQVVDDEQNITYACLWDICGHKTTIYPELFRHINYHAYHAKLLAIGFNGRATLDLERCKKDSSKRNQLPRIPEEHCCMWTDCELKFNGIQNLFDHVKLHINYSENNLCSWAGCGCTFKTKGLLNAHLRSHTGERLIACYHCGQHFANNRKLCDHLRRQNVDPNSSFACTMCGTRCATEYLLNEHARQHVSAHVCALCDMTATSPAALAHHVRYRHLPPPTHHACPHCAYRAVTKNDLQKHLLTHDRKRKTQSDDEDSDISDNSVVVTKKNRKVPKKYACHMCPDDKVKIFTRGTILTTHLVKKHGVQWPYGHSRFRYQKSEDGFYRLTTTRYEVLEVSNKIFARDVGLNLSLNENVDFRLHQISEPTEDTPRRFQITLGSFKQESETEGLNKEKIDETELEEEVFNENINEEEFNEVEFNKEEIFKEESVKQENKSINDFVEITMCDVDDKGNVINTKVINSFVCKFEDNNT